MGYKTTREPSESGTNGMMADWAQEEEVGAQANNTHLWEESWDDDDTSDDFSVQLK